MQINVAGDEGGGRVVSHKLMASSGNCPFALFLNRNLKFEFQVCGSAILCVGCWLAVDKTSFIHLTKFQTLSDDVQVCFNLTSLLFSFFVQFMFHHFRFTLYFVPFSLCFSCKTRPRASSGYVLFSGFCICLRPFFFLLLTFPLFLLKTSSCALRTSYISTVFKVIN